MDQPTDPGTRPEAAGARLIANPLVDRGRVQPAAPRCVAFHASLPGFAATPVDDAPGAAEQLGVARVLVKRETERLGLPSFKILGASWAVCRELAHRWNLGDAAGVGFPQLKDAATAHPELVLVAPTDGNHGRAVARMARLLGLRSIVLVPAGTVAARKEGIASEGAQVIETTGDYDQTVAQAAAMEDGVHAVISDTSWEGYTRAPADVIEGYATMMAEVVEAIDGGLIPEPTVVTAQIGVGGLAAAVARGFAARPARLLVGVEPTSADCVTASMEAGHIVTSPGPQTSIMAGLNCGTPSAIAWPDVSAGFDAMSVIDDQAAAEAMRLLHRDGIDAGESGAAGLAGLLAHADVLELRPTDVVLVVVTEGPTDPINHRRIVDGN
ncbi:diaminopropionate ammonia-lyase [Brooklawnia cerclae]